MSHTQAFDSCASHPAPTGAAAGELDGAVQRREGEAPDIDDTRSLIASSAHYDVEAPRGVVALQHSVRTHVAVCIAGLLMLAVAAHAQIVPGLLSLESALKDIRSAEESKRGTGGSSLDVDEQLLVVHAGGAEGMLYITLIGLQVLLMSIGQQEAKPTGGDAVSGPPSRVPSGRLPVSRGERSQPSNSRETWKCVASQCRTTPQSLPATVRSIMLLIATLTVVDRALAVTKSMPALYISPDGERNANGTLLAPVEVPAYWHTSVVSLSAPLVLATHDSFILELCMLLSGQLCSPLSRKLVWRVRGIAYASYGLGVASRLAPERSASLLGLLSALTLGVGGVWAMCKARRRAPPSESSPVGHEHRRHTKPTDAILGALTSDRSTASEPASDRPPDASLKLGESAPLSARAPSTRTSAHAYSVPLPEFAELYAHEENRAHQQLRFIGLVGYIALATVVGLHAGFRALDRAVFSFRLAPFVDSAILVAKGALLPTALLIALWSVQQRLSLRISLHERAELQHTQYLRERKLLRYICHELRSPLNTLSLVTEELTFMAQQHAHIERSIVQQPGGDSGGHSGSCDPSNTSGVLHQAHPPQREGDHALRGMRALAVSHLSNETPTVPTVRPPLHEGDAANRGDTGARGSALPAPTVHEQVSINPDLQQTSLTGGKPHPFTYAELGEVLTDLSASSLTAVVDIQHSLDNIVMLEAARSDQQSPVPLDLLRFVGDVFAHLGGVARERRAYLDVRVATSQSARTIRSQPTPRQLSSLGSKVQPLLTAGMITLPTAVLHGRFPQLGVRAMPGCLRHVLNVLVSNAIRFGTAMAPPTTPSGRRVGGPALLGQVDTRPRDAHCQDHATSRSPQVCVPAQPVDTITPTPMVVEECESQQASLSCRLPPDLDRARAVRVEVVTISGATVSRTRGRDAVIIAPPPGPANLPELRAAEHSVVLYVEVQDFGAGIERGELGLLFKEFAMIRSGAHVKQNSTGLGLAVARHLVVSRMKGLIGAWSEGVGRGATFWFAVPLPTIPAHELGVETGTASFISSSDSSFALEGAASMLYARIKQRTPTGKHVGMHQLASRWPSHAPTAPIPSASAQGFAHQPIVMRRVDIASSAPMADQAARPLCGTVSMAPLSSTTGSHSCAAALDGHSRGATDTDTFLHSAQATNSDPNGGAAATEASSSAPSRNSTHRNTRRADSSAARGLQEIPQSDHQSAQADHATQSPRNDLERQTHRAPDPLPPAELGVQSVSASAFANSHTTDGPAVVMNVRSLQIEDSDNTEPASTKPIAPSPTTARASMVAPVLPPNDEANRSDASTSGDAEHTASSSSPTMNRVMRVVLSEQLDRDLRLSSSRSTSTASHRGAATVDACGAAGPEMAGHLHSDAAASSPQLPACAGPTLPPRVLRHAHSSGVKASSQSPGTGMAHICDLPVNRTTIPPLGQPDVRARHIVRGASNGATATLSQWHTQAMSSPVPPSEPAPLAWLTMTMVVDDVPSNRRFLAQLLQRLGVNTVLVAEDGEDAFTQLLQMAQSSHDQEHPPTKLAPLETDSDPVKGIRVLADLHRILPIVLTDQEMPRCKGHELAQKLRACGYQGHILGVTGNAHRTDIETMVAAGMEDVMIKPVTRGELLKRLARLIPGRHHMEGRESPHVRQERGGGMMSPTSHSEI